MGHYPEPRLHRLVLGRLGAAEGELAELLSARGRGRIPHELLGTPARIDVRGLCRELDGLSAVGSLRLPTAFLDEVAGAPAPELLPVLLREVDRLGRLRALRLPGDAFDGVPAATVDCWRHRALAGLPAESPGARLPLLAALCWCRQAELTRELLAVLLALIGELRERVAERIRRATAPAGGRRWQRWEQRGDGWLPQDVDEHRCRAARAALHVAFTSDYRQVLTAILEVLEFGCSDRARWPLLAVLGEQVGEATRCWGSERRYLDGRSVPLRGIVPAPWLHAVLDRQGRVDRTAYELCVLIALREALTDDEIHARGTAAPEPALGDPVGTPISWPQDLP
ncbi:hypothetical protein ACL03H_18765 [Saccharopolyspora sp. MS10]|uniref:hypothetical protein n=1 Tax=Saccharopolyspora sp. MS10 TaxID=3385973 RepID=UPI0039A22A89